MEPFFVFAGIMLLAGMVLVGVAAIVHNSRSRSEQLLDDEEQITQISQ